MLEALRSLKPYERRFFILMIISSITNSFPILTFLVTQYQPPFTCQHNNYSQSLATTKGTSVGASIVRNSTAVANNLTNLHSKVEACSILRQNFNESVSNSSMEYKEKLPCENFQYDLNFNENSALTEFNFVCEDAWVNDMAISMFMWGMTFGGVFGGVLSDRFGRKAIFLAATFIQFFFTFTVSFATDKISYLVLAFLNGGGNLINYGAAAVLGFETLPKNCHNAFYYGLVVLYAIGNMILPGMAYCLRDWRWFCRLCGLVGIFYIPYFWIIDESPCWLYASKKADALEKLIRKINKYNGEDGDDKFYNRMMLLKQEDKPKDANVWKTWRAIFKHRNLVGRLLAVLYSWSMTSLIYHAIVLNTNSLTGDRFLNCFLSASTEVVALTLCYFVSEKVEHRYIFISSIAIGGIAIAITPFVAESSGIGATMITMIARFCAAIAFYILYVYVPVLFPTNMRNSTTGLSSSVSRLIGILTPLVMHGTSSRIASLIIGGLLILCALLNLSLPNTKNKKLPTTVDEAIKLEKINNMSSFIDDEEANNPLSSLQA